VAEARKLKLKLRAERQAQTRQRIVEAAVELHGTRGPARTTITAIAEHAGVERVTVYRHFPDDRSLLEACSAHVRAQVPPPNPRPWKKLSDPRTRTETALTELYPYFRLTSRGWAAILRDAEILPIVREIAEKRRLGYLAEVRDILAVGWGVRGERRELLRAALGLAVDFRTWETLAEKQGLSDAQAVQLVTDIVVRAPIERL